MFSEDTAEAAACYKRGLSPNERSFLERSYAQKTYIEFAAQCHRRYSRDSRIAGVRSAVDETNFANLATLARSGSDLIGNRVMRKLTLLSIFCKNLVERRVLLNDP